MGRVKVRAPAEEPSAPPVVASRYPGLEFDSPTLGLDLLDWFWDYLSSPRDENEPLQFTHEQALILLEWFRVDSHGRFIYRRGCSRRSKGFGKSPLMAAMAVAELAGPVRFDGWGADGRPIGRPWGCSGDPAPLVQIAAVSFEQADDNTYSAIHAYLDANDGKAADELRIDHGLTRCYLRDRPGKLEAVSASAGAREGQRVTFVNLDEVHLWVPSNKGRKLARTVRRNVAKMGGRSYETTNSFVPGEQSIAESTHAAIENGDPGIFSDAVEAPPVREEDDDQVLRAALAVAYGDSSKDVGGWVDLDRLVAEIRDHESTWEDSQRFYFNHPVDDRMKVLQQHEWNELARPHTTIPAGTHIGVGFDGSISDDATALIGCAIVDGIPHTFEIEVWTRPERAPENWRIPRREVLARVAETFEVYSVGLMLCDPAKWQSEIENWIDEYGTEHVAMLDTNKPSRMAPACGRFSTAIEEKAYTHDGSSILGSHVLAMHRRKVRLKDDDDDGRTKYVFVKGPDREKKIDAGIGAVLALEAAMTMPAAEEEQEFFAAWV